MAASSSAPEQRFSDRVENYVRYRPSYPQEIIPLLQKDAGLSPDSSIADIGSGTGLSTEMFLRAGYQVKAVEPNLEMRQAAERLLTAYSGFLSVEGSAQATTLPDQSVDILVAAQAFHWFNTAETRAEFTRILQPNGRVVLIWNERKLDATPFLRDYEQLLVDYGTDYSEVRHENIGATALGHFFIGPYAVHEFGNEQRFDFEGLKGRLLSSSYAPPAGHSDHAPMLAELLHLFDRHQTNGQVVVEYITRVYIGH